MRSARSVPTTRPNSPRWPPTPPPTLALQALGVLAADSPDLVKTLLDALEDKSKELRAAAALALGKAGAKKRAEAFPALVAALKDAEADVRTAAVAGLEAFGAPTEKESVLL